MVLTELRLPAIKQIWPNFAERDRRRIERHLAEAKLLPGKTLDNFDFNSVPMVSTAEVSRICRRPSARP